MKQNVRIILVCPSHPGNIGAAARAMKTMGISKLYLVSPKHFPHVDATARAAGADDILENAIITNSLADALCGTQIVFGTSSRSRALPLPLLSPRQTAQLIKKESRDHQIAIVFGRENNGLNNEELEMCNYHVYIPTIADFYSLNLAAAVQIVTYELKMVEEQLETQDKPQAQDLANAEEINSFHQHLQQILVAIKFVDLKNPRRVLSRLKLLFNRARLQKNEIHILRGILATIESKIK